jgi:squalene synthase HpnC
LTAMAPVNVSAVLAGAPVEYTMPATRPTLAEARAWCRHLATTHYENFHVATWFLPRAARPHFESIYAFSRVADDLGDEVADRETALRLLGEWRDLLHECYAEPQRSRHPVFIALQATIAETQVPEQLFADLIQAFMQDQEKTHFDSVQELIDYSRLSANPVGRLVLWVSGYRDEPRALLSDKVCTALQLANFWQDVVEDWQRGRRYLPTEAMHQFGVTDEQIAERRFTPEFRAMMEHLVDATGAMLADGGRLCEVVDRQLAVTLRLFVGGGRAALDGVVAESYNVLARRPSVSKSTKAKLIAGALTGKLRSLLPGRGGPA